VSVGSPAPIDCEVAEAIGRDIVAAVADRDWPRFAACLAPDVAFRAVVPSLSEPFREHHGPDAVRAQMAAWFDGGDEYELLASTVEVIADRLHVSYRARGEDGGWYLVEQHLFASIPIDLVTDVNLLCSGFQDIPPPA
jgi:ketosteroid isomerase-like protein